MSYKLRIRDFREKKKMKQSELADAIGVSSRVLGGWERMETGVPFEYIPACAHALGVTPNDLCNWYEDHPMTGSPHISHDEEILLRDYRAATPERRRALTMTARDYAGMSKASEVDSRQVEKKKAV
ncbi:helix-turn-helix transcriptional regulator [Collinsella sp. AGMB00827]|uniref:Helix-turn-helix transcriptional regulator n=1 Tax=Collinsella ureilytica TaxID=2869515 RepID=A0ABS7MMX0_9ACTN|nr:helix-turn-helix transcriptional regulator [Collinsella urealyticum]MBY4798396.1 helix-turn-helix transcriptional regulator [Collinsella urealyticum]